MSKKAMISKNSMESVMLSPISSLQQSLPPTQEKLKNYIIKRMKSARLLRLYMILKFPAEQKLKKKKLNQRKRQKSLKKR